VKLLGIEIPTRGDPYYEVKRQIAEEMRYERMMQKDKSEKFKDMTDEKIYDFWYSTDGAFFMGDRHPIELQDLMDFLDMIRIIRNGEALITRYNNYVASNKRKLIGHRPVKQAIILSSFYTIMQIKAGELGIRTVGWKSSVPPALREVARLKARTPLESDEVRTPQEQYGIK
jgi:hypothetical protein